MYVNGQRGFWLCHFFSTKRISTEGLLTSTGNEDFRNVNGVEVNGVSTRSNLNGVSTRISEMLNEC